MARLGRWLLIAANLGILAGLTFAVLQIRQSYEAVADRAAIEDVIAQYAHRWDSKDATGFAALFTEDATTEHVVLGELKSRIEGRPALLAYARESHEGRLADRQTRHHMSGIVLIELSAHPALTQNLVLITHQTSADPVGRIVSIGTYRNTWRKTDGGWKIAKRVLVTDRVED